MGFYSKDKLMEVVIHRGYRTVRAVADALAPLFEVAPSTMAKKIREGELSKEECEVIGSYFQMTMKEYYDVFMRGLFVEDIEGHYVCYIKEPYKHIHTTKKTKAHRKKSVRGHRTDRLLEQIQNIGKEDEET